MVQAEFPPSYPTMLSLRPLGSTGVTPLPRYCGPVRLPTSSPPGYAFPKRRTTKGWVSQVPRPICRDALSPITPESPTGASVQCFPADAGFILFGGLATPIGVTRPNRVYLTLRLAASHRRGFGCGDCSPPRSSGYMYSGLFTRCTPFSSRDRPDLS